MIRDKALLVFSEQPRTSLSASEQAADAFGAATVKKRTQSFEVTTVRGRIEQKQRRFYANPRFELHA